MKKVKVLVLSFVCLVMILCSGCSKKTAITVDIFKEKMEELDYIVQDVSSHVSDYDYVLNAYVAIAEDGKHQIEFYEFKDKDNAYKFYQNNKKIFEDSKGTKTAETNVELSGYQKYTLQTGGKYKTVSRIGTTVIYLDVDETYKNDVKNALKKIGY